MPIDRFFTSGQSIDLLYRDAERGSVLDRKAGKENGLVNWLSELAFWEYFNTSTFSKPHRDKFVAGKIYEDFMNRVLPGVSYFYAVETHPGGHGEHIHGLLSGCYAGLFKERKPGKQWAAQHGLCKTERIRSAEGVHNYVLKYVVGDPDALFGQNIKEGAHKGEVRAI